MIIQRFQLLLLSFLLIASLVGCNRSKPADAGKTGAPAPQAENDDNNGGENIKVFNAEGKAILKLKFRQNGYKLSVPGSADQPDQTLARIKIDDDSVKVKDGDGNDLYKLKTKEAKIKIEDGAGQLLYSLQPKEEDFKLEDAQGQVVYRVKKEDYGFKVTDAKDQVLGKIKAASPRIKIENAEGKTMMELKGVDNPLAASALAMERLDERQRTALMVMLNRRGSSGK